MRRVIAARNAPGRDLEDHRCHLRRISESTQQRSDFAAVVAAGGAPALIAHLNELSDNLMKP
jgi:hypothetical protein